MGPKKPVIAALEYLPEFDEQPLVTIRTDVKAEVDLILSLAKKHKIPVIEDGVLAGQLADLAEGDSLPARLFRAVAALFNQIDSIMSTSEEQKEPRRAPAKGDF